MRACLKRFGSILLLLLLAVTAATAQAINQAPGGGAVPVKYLSAASTNATLVKAGAATLYGLQIVNTTTTLYYFKLYDKATAPTCASDTVLKTLPVPFVAGSAGGVLVVPFVAGLGFKLGLGFCLTAGSADSDNANAVTGVAINIDYR